MSTCFPVRTVTAAASHCGCAAAWRNWMKVTGWPHFRQALPEELRLSPHRYLATNTAGRGGYSAGVSGAAEADEVLPAPLPPYRVPTGLVDRFGRTHRRSTTKPPVNSAAKSPA
ncbi:hypothetical protein GS581_07900 [Escherichia coli]|nr:hypothetical protein [Escherichia coli]